MYRSPVNDNKTAWKFVVKDIAAYANVRMVINRRTTHTCAQYEELNILENPNTDKVFKVMKPNHDKNNRPGAKASPPLCLPHRFSIQQGECKSEKSGETDFKLQRIAAHP